MPLLENWRNYWRSSLPDETVPTLGKIDPRKFRSLLADIDYDDIEVVDHLLRGFRMTGKMEMKGHKDVDGGL